MGAGKGSTQGRISASPRVPLGLGSSPSPLWLSHARAEKTRLPIGAGSIEAGFWPCDETWEPVCPCLPVLGTPSFPCHLKLPLREGGGISDAWAYGWSGGLHPRVPGLCDLPLGTGGLLQDAGATPAAVSGARQVGRRLYVEGNTEGMEVARLACWRGRPGGGAG